MTDQVDRTIEHLIESSAYGASSLSDLRPEVLC